MKLENLVYFSITILLTSVNEPWVWRTSVCPCYCYDVKQTILGILEEMLHQDPCDRADEQPEMKQTSGHILHRDYKAG